MTDQTGPSHRPAETDRQAQTDRPARTHRTDSPDQSGSIERRPGLGLVDADRNRWFRTSITTRSGFGTVLGSVSMFLFAVAFGYPAVRTWPGIEPATQSLLAVEGILDGERVLGLFALRDVGGLIQDVDPWLFVGLTVAGLAGVAGIVPAELEKSGRDPADLSLLLVMLNALLVNGVLVGVAVLIGLTLGERAGFAVASAGLANRGVLIVAPVTGVVIAGVLAVLDQYVFGGLDVDGNGNGNGNGNGDQLPVLYRFLASLYGGITEELLTRFGLLSLLAFAGWRILTPTAPAPPGYVVWTAIVLAAVLFGAGHLPATAKVADLTPRVISRALLLNGLAGVLFGWLFWQFGLVAAMVSHFTTDLVIYVFLPAVVRPSD